MSLLDFVTTKRPPLGQVFDKLACYRLVMDSGAELSLKEFYVQETEYEHNVYLRVAHESICEVKAFVSIADCITRRANKHCERLILESDRFRHYTLDEICSEFLHILVSDKQNMNVNLAPGKPLFGYYRVSQLGSVTKAIDIDLSNLGVISRFERCI